MMNPFPSDWWRNPATVIAVALAAVFVFTLGRVLLVPIFAGLAAIAAAVSIAGGVWLLLRFLKLL